MTATEELRRLLDERGVKWWQSANTLGCIFTRWYSPLFGDEVVAMENGEEGLVLFDHFLTPEQAIAATLGQRPWVNPTWERWHKSLKHDEIKSIGDAVEQLMYEAIEFGGDMGPNGNTYNGIDEGDVLTSGFINEWVARFESTLGRDRYSYEQWREISNAVGDAMEYAHNKAIECPDEADPLWNLDEYVNRILKAAFEGGATLGDADATGERQGDAGTCKLDDFADVPFSVDYEIEGYDMGSGRDYATLAECSACGAYIIVPPEYHHVLTCDGDEVYQPYRFCPNCGRRVV